MEKKVRTRFAPSPTGGLHLGGVRTVLYSYLFARQHDGQFVLRIEDTDQSRYVPGAEEYIYECLHWCGLKPDESPEAGGKYGPYRQSERKSLYRQYAEQLIRQGNAYYAFDTQQELDTLRKEHQEEGHAGFQYDAANRMKLKNSLTLSKEETETLLAQKTPYVIRIKLPENEEVSFHDMIRGEVIFNTNIADDKVLLKADGMPTYHLAVVVDDYLMKITHAFRGEEWLSSAPVHILLWKYLDWEADMPQWAHLPLILKPDGKGKLSKRDSERLGFPVFAMNWRDPKTEEFVEGFREKGFFPEAFINMLALLGWNDGSEQEIFSLEEMIKNFSIERVHKGGAKFDYEKACWFNHEYIKAADNERLGGELVKLCSLHDVPTTLDYASTIAGLIKDRCALLPELWDNSFFFFQRPKQYDTEAVKAKWDEEKKTFFKALTNQYESLKNFDYETVENTFKTLAAGKNIKAGALMLPFRIMLTGGKFGPPVFVIAETLGKEETLERINAALPHFG